MFGRVEGQYITKQHWLGHLGDYDSQWWRWGLLSKAGSFADELLSYDSGILLRRAAPAWSSRQLQCTLITDFWWLVREGSFGKTDSFTDNVSIDKSLLSSDDSGKDVSTWISHTFSLEVLSFDGYGSRMRCKSFIWCRVQSTTTDSSHAAHFEFWGVSAIHKPDPNMVLHFVHPLFMQRFVWEDGIKLLDSCWITKHTCGQ